MPMMDMTPHGLPRERLSKFLPFFLCLARKPLLGMRVLTPPFLISRHLQRPVLAAPLGLFVKRGSQQMNTTAG